MRSYGMVNIDAVMLENIHESKILNHIHMLTYKHACINLLKSTVCIRTTHTLDIIKLYICL